MFISGSRSVRSCRWLSSIVCARSSRNCIDIVLGFQVGLGDQLCRLDHLDAGLTAATVAWHRLSAAACHRWRLYSSILRHRAIVFRARNAASALGLGDMGEALLTIDLLREASSGSMQADLQGVVALGGCHVGFDCFDVGFDLGIVTSLSPLGKSASLASGQCGSGRRSPGSGRRGWGREDFVHAAQGRRAFSSRSSSIRLRLELRDGALGGRPRLGAGARRSSPGRGSSPRVEQIILRSLNRSMNLYALVGSQQP